MEKIKKRADNWLIILAVLYIIVPIVIFMMGWLKPVIAFLISLLLGVLAIRVVKSVEKTESVSITKNGKFWLVSLGLISVWVLLSGIGYFSYQTWDFNGRNPMYRDLYTNCWPVYYDMTQQSEIVKELSGNAERGMYVYYFSWWLPPALVTKLLGMIGIGKVGLEAGAKILLYLWAVLGLFLTFYCLVRFFKKYSYWILSSFILFGGFDVVVYLFKNLSLPQNTHVEWWADLFQYSANTTQVYWVFNQTIPIWLIVAVLILLCDNKVVGGWAATGMAFAPFPTLGMIPIAIAALFNRQEKGKITEKIKEAVTIENIVIPLSLAVVFGSFYMLVLGKASASPGFIFVVEPFFKAVTCYILFIIFEFFIYFVVMGKKEGKQDKFYWVTLVELLLIPMYKMGGANDFAMRVSIPPLFLLMILCLQKLFYAKRNKIRQKEIAISICLLVGYLTSISEVQRNLSLTLQLEQEEWAMEDIYSLGNIKTEDSGVITLMLSQYVALDNEYEDSFFYKYLAEK